MMTSGKNREDDTTEEAQQPQPEEKSEPHSYYYDDATGYEIYEPTAPREEDEPED